MTRSKMSCGDDYQLFSGEDCWYISKIFSRMYAVSYELREHRSSVVVAEHTIFDPRVIGLSD